MQPAFCCPTPLRPALLLLQLGAALAYAQSSALLERVRTHDPRAPHLAEEELGRCLQMSCPEQGALALLAGTLELSRGNPQQALQLLTRTPASGPLAAYRLYYEAEARFYTGDFGGAAQTFQEAATASPSPLLTRRAKVRRAEALLQIGEVAPALTLLEADSGEAGSPELLYDRALARFASHQLPQARSDLHDLLAHAATHPASANALLLLQKLPPPPVALTLGERLARAKLFFEAGALTAAQAELDLIDHQKLARTRADRARVALQREALLYAQGKDAEAERQLKRATHGDPEIGAQAMLMRGRRMMRGPGVHPDAQQYMVQISHRFPHADSGEEAAFLAGWLLIQNGEYLKGADQLAAFDVRHPHSRRREEAAWFRAYGLIRANHDEEAGVVLSAMLQHFPRSNLVPQVRYWRARLEELQGGAPADAYAQVIEQFPASFYAWLAAERLRTLKHAPPNPFPQPPRLAVAPRLSQLGLAQALSSAGLLRDARDEIEHQVFSARTTQEALALATALAHLDEFGFAYQLAAQRLWAEAYAQRSPDALALLFPRAFETRVMRNAQDENASPSMLWAIMRRESLFQPDLLSGANARGLMQLVPPTAAAIARQMHEPAPAPDALYSPGMNVHLAAWYVARLTERFEHPVLVAAAYNAGPQVAARWARENGELPVDLFVEAIPYKETRGYVKQVVADYFNYQAFYAAPFERTRLSFQIPAPEDQGINF